jgi:ClpX C4-type zinc finger protein
MAEVSQDLEPTCAFCGGRQTQVRRLVIGFHVAICNECVDVAREILDDEQITPAGLPERLDRQWLESENRRLRRLLRTRGMDPDTPSDPEPPSEAQDPEP